MLFTLDRLLRLLSLLVSPEPNQPREMDNLEQSLFISQHVTLVCLWTSAFDVSPAFFIDIHPVFGPEILCYFSSSEASSSSYSHPFLHLVGQKAPEPGRPPPPPPHPPSHCSWPQGGRGSHFCGFHTPDYGISCKNMRPSSLESCAPVRLSIKPTLQSENIFCCGSTFFPAPFSAFQLFLPLFSPHQRAAT